MTGMNAVRELTGCQPQTIDAAVYSSTEPLVLKSLVTDWPIVKAGRQSPQAAVDYILQFYSGELVTAAHGPPSIKGRVGYNEDLTDFNFDRATVTLGAFFERLLRHIDDPDPPAYYIGSTVADRWFPGFCDANDLMLEGVKPLTSLWIGNQIRVSAHFDVTDNIACSVVGRRTFTLFPPDQIDNLYIGPWDMTPAGRAISLVDFHNPDFDQYPKFRKALESAYEVTLEPGDALFLPSMWWHHVESLESLNVLVNYWWRTTPNFMGAPESVLRHALLGLRGLPPEQRRAWQHIFERYVFDPQESATAHIPEHSRGILASMDDLTARKLRADLLNRLNR
jgi:hypothetical protein